MISCHHQSEIRQIGLNFAGGAVKAGAGYVYHDYEDLAASYVWSTVRNHLPPLRVVVTQEPAALDPSVG
jgi:hypothetical protein